MLDKTLQEKMAHTPPYKLFLDEVTMGRARLSADDILTFLMNRYAALGISLYAAQEEAILELYADRNVILATPTGSGKSLVAHAFQYKSLVDGKRSIYTCPIKALVNEKFLHLCQEFGPEYVGMVTGDASVNPDAPIICCTAEILANLALREGAYLPFQHIIMDEFHFYSDRERGSAWQIPILLLKNARFLLMSATMGDASFFEKELTALTGAKTVIVSSDQRPVPLTFAYGEEPLDVTISDLISQDKAPIYLVHFTQREATQNAQNFLSLNICSREEKQKIAEGMSHMVFATPFGKEMKKLLSHGIGLHHAGLLPKYRILVEQLAQKGLLKLIFGTDTLGVGVNVPIRSVIFTQLCKYDGDKTRLLSVRDFHQICGRAGRKGFDNQGFVLVQAPEHVIENRKLEIKAGQDPKKLRKIVRKKPPLKGYVHWDKMIYEKLRDSVAEPLQSRFEVNHGMIIQVIANRFEDGCHSLKTLLSRCHESAASKVHLRKRGFQLLRSLLEKNIIGYNPDEATKLYRKFVVNIDLQSDFSLNQSLSLFLLDILRYTDMSKPDYAYQVLTLVESIVENPAIILQRQLDAVKTRKMAEMKEAGLEYEERMAELEKLEYPKPMADFIYDNFNAYAKKHPWIGQENIMPKSVAREMYEQYLSFGDYIREYGLERAEGVLLRYLSSVYKVLVQTVPDYVKTEAIREMIVYFGTMIRDVDSSLLDEWQRLRDEHREEKGKKPLEIKDDYSVANDITSYAQGFEVLIRNRIFRIIAHIARGGFEQAIKLCEKSHYTQEQLEELMTQRREGGGYLQTDAKARHRDFSHIHKKDRFEWQVEQILCDSEEHNDWHMVFSVDILQSKHVGYPALILTEVGPIGGV